jgi:hypothetical protein
MANFTAGTSFGANDTVTNTKLNALIADASINPEYAINLNSGTIGTLSCTKGTIPTFVSTTGTIATINSTTGNIGAVVSTSVSATSGTVQTLTASTLTGVLTGGTYTGSIGTSASLTAGTVQTLTASTLTGVLTGGTYTGSIGTSCNFTAGTIGTFTGSSDATINSVRVGQGVSGNITSVVLGNTASTNSTASGGCTSIGYQANKSIVSTFNTAVGYNANSGTNNNSGGGYNTSVGAQTLIALTSGSQNTNLGYGAGDDITSGNSNTCIGYFAGNTTTGTNNTHIGNSASDTTGGATASNTIVLGNSAITTLRCQTATISALSDARDKSNIEDIPVGLDFVKDLRPVKFTWNQRDGMRVGLTDAGFIAQESLDAVNKHNADWIGLVEHQNQDQFAMAPGKLIPVLVKAIQQLSSKVESLEAQLANK